jgi:sugar lactone lactonase YvrE
MIINRLFIGIAVIFITELITPSCCSQGQVSNMKIEKLSEIKAKLGEGSIWDYKRQILYWIDIEGCMLYEFSPVSKQTTSHRTGKKPGTVVPESETTVVLGLEDGVYRMFLQNDSLELIAKPSSLLANQRFNDGKCDPQGRFWLGSIGPRKSCFLYCMDNEGKIKEVLDSVTTSNGIIWSPDSTKMYYTDTNTRQIRQFSFDGKTGNLSNEKVIIEIPDGMGAPDGMTIDAEGKLWVAMWGGHAVCRFDPETGSLLQRIEVPAINVTSCAFGGKDLDILYVTSSSQNMSENDSLNLPDAGKLHCLRPGVKGINANYYINSK